jgi:diguanylate cyclase (GGDEF)-like protein/PAS domain S-box-containing protein
MPLLRAAAAKHSATGIHQMRDQLYHSIFQSATVALVVVDSAKKVIEWNPEAEKLFGWTGEEAIGTSLDTLVMPRAPEHRNILCKCLDSTQSFTSSRQAELVALNKDGIELDIELNATPIRHDGAPCLSLSIRDLSGQKKVEKKLLQTQFELQAALQANKNIMDHSLDVICLVDRLGRFVQVSKACEKTWGYAPEELEDRPYIDLVHPDDRAETLDVDQYLASNRFVRDFENRTLHKSGRVVDMLWTCSWSEEDELYYCIARDISEMRKESRKLRESEQRFRSLFENHTDAVFSFDMDGNFLTANNAVSTLTGYSIADLHCMSFHPLIAPEYLDEVVASFIVSSRGQPQNFDTICVRKDGTRFDVHVTTLPMTVNDKIVGVHGIARDITYNKNYERQIEYLANYDSLTGLPNRNLLDDRVRHAIIQADRLGSQIGVLYLDINRFKIINDSLGHDKGDMLLQIVANRLCENVREGDTVARIGSDEFVVVLENISMVEAISVIASDLLNAVAEPIKVGAVDLTVSTSIGVSVYPKDGADNVMLLKNADLAMYQAKQAGPGTFRFYSSDMNVKVLARLIHETNLRAALEKEELVLHYQPRVDVASKKIVGIEALVRWLHPEKGLISPLEFIPLAEEIGLIGELGEWVLKTACRQNRLWQEQGLPPMKVSVNLSAQQLSPASTINRTIQQVLSETGMDARWLELEITESTLMQNIEATLSILLEIRDSGVSISIDDFGTGYSSLSYLKRLPIDTLKIDKSFIRDIAIDHDDAAIVTATIAMAHTMRLKVVAEGVTSKEQIRFLESHRCDEVQGFLLSYPLPADELHTVLKSGRWDIASGELLH